MQSLTTGSDPDTPSMEGADQTCRPVSPSTISPAGPSAGPVVSPPAGSGKESAVSKGRSGLYALLALSVFAIGLVYGGYFERVRSMVNGPLDNYFRSAGLVLQKIQIKGQVNLGDEQVIALLGIRSGQSLVGFDALRAQKRLSSLGQVRSARVMRLLPSTLLVEIEERVPFARWLHEGRMELVDEDGFVLVGVSPENRSYPLVVGEGAATRAARLIRILATHENLAGRIKMAERVGQYRWNLHAKSGAVIKLPRHELALALARFVTLPDWNRLLSRKNMVIDLRLRGRAFVREVRSSGRSARSRS